MEYSISNAAEFDRSKCYFQKGTPLSFSLSAKVFSGVKFVGLFCSVFWTHCKNVSDGSNAIKTSQTCIQ